MLSQTGDMETVAAVGGNPGEHLEAQAMVGKRVKRFLSSGSGCRKECIYKTKVMPESNRTAFLFLCLNVALLAQAHGVPLKFRLPRYLAYSDPPPPGLKPISAVTSQHAHHAE